MLPAVDMSPAGSIVRVLHHKLKTQSSSPEDGRNYRPKYVELIEVINKLSLLYRVGCLYRVIHKSVKHFKNSQQINYSTDHGSSYADRERNFSSFLHVSQMLNVSP